MPCATGVCTVAATSMGLNPLVGLPVAAFMTYKSLSGHPKKSCNIQKYNYCHYKQCKQEKINGSKFCDSHKNMCYDKHGCKKECKQYLTKKLQTKKKQTKKLQTKKKQTKKLQGGRWDPTFKGPKKKRHKPQGAPKEHAESFRSGIKRKGKDGQKWVSKFVVDGPWFGMEWVPVNQKQVDNSPYGRMKQGKDKELLEFWHLLAEGNSKHELGIVLIYKNGSHKIVKSKKKTHQARVNEINDHINKANNDPKVKAYLTSSPSWDTYERFQPKVQGKSISHIIKHYKKYFIHNDHKSYGC